MKEWQWEKLREQHALDNVSKCEVACYEDGTPVPEGVDAYESYWEDWYKCECCGKKYKTKDEAIDCCFPKYHVDYEE